MMCERYQLRELAPGARAILWEVRHRFPQTIIRKGELFPTNTVPIFVWEHSRLLPIPAHWGFGSGKGALPAIDLPHWQDQNLAPDFLKRRCVVPTTGFFGWEGKGEKYLFAQSEHSLLFLAGIWQWEGEQRHFSLLTVPTPHGQPGLHHLQPLVLPAPEIGHWLREESFATAFCAQPPICPKGVLLD